MSEPYVRKGQKLRIKSTGTTLSTSVCVVGDDGREEMLANVIAVSWSAGMDEAGQHDTCKATVMFDLVEVDVEAEAV